MAHPSKWDQYDVTNLVRQILASFPPEAQYQTGRPFVTTYQIAIEFTSRFPTIAAALADSTGGEGEGPYALTTYLARWLPEKIKQGATDIELRFLEPRHLETMQFDTGMTATTNQRGFGSTMFRLGD